jgi:hypothetical protein
MIRFLLICVFVALAGAQAQAIVFNIKDAGFGFYLKGRYSPWTNGQTPFSESSGTNVSWNGQFDFIPSYEFGFLASSKRLTWKLGFEFLSLPQQNITGSDSTTKAAYYTIASNVSAVNPKIGFEFNLKTWNASRWYLTTEGGISYVDIQNTYAFTTAGTSKYGIANFREEVKGQQSFYAAGVGFETLLSDNTTFEFEGGYRVLDYTALTHNLAVTGFQGAVAVGAPANTNTGGPRDLNMSGGYAGVSFRVWIN